MPTVESTVELLSLLADPTRVRLLALLCRHELTVTELMAALELGQSRVSTHLGKLREAGLLRDRRVGASVFYAVEAMPEGAKALWGLVEGQLQDGGLEGDRVRCEAVLRARAGSAGWPDAVAGKMDLHYSPGRTWEATARALISLLSLGDVLDVGGGDGAIAGLLLPRCRSMTLLEQSERLLDAARERLGGGGERLRLVRGDMHELPFERGAFDQVLLFNVLACSERPAVVLAEAARVLRPGGVALVVTLAAHEHGEVTAAYQHVQEGFTPRALRTMMQRSGLVVEGCEVSSRERRPPYFEVITAMGRRGHEGAEGA
jgi:ArsR family transcriptional regulator